MKQDEDDRTALESAWTSIHDAQQITRDVAATVEAARVADEQRAADGARQAAEKEAAERIERERSEIEEQARRQADERRAAEAQRAETERAAAAREAQERVEREREVREEADRRDAAELTRQQAEEASRQAERLQQAEEAALAEQVKLAQTNAEEIRRQEAITAEAAAQQRAAELADTDRQLALEREDAQRRLDLSIDSRFARAQADGKLDPLSNNLQMLADREMAGLGVAIDKRNELARRDSDLEGQMTAPTLGWDRNQAIFVKDEVVQAANVAAARQQTESSVDEPSGKTTVGRQLPPMGTIEPAFSDLSGLTQGMAQYTETTEKLERDEQIGDLAVDLMKETQEVHEASGIKVLSAKTIAEVGVDHHPGHGTMIGIEGNDPQQLKMQASLGDGHMDGLPILATLAAVQVAKVAEQGWDWLEQRFGGAREAALAIGDDGYPAGRQIGGAAIDPSTLNALPTIDAGNALEKTVDWNPSGLDGRPTDAHDRHEAFFEGVPVLGGVPVGGKSTEQHRAEAGLAEWQAFKQEQGQLDVGIKEAYEAGAVDKAQMLELRKHLEGCDFAHQTAGDVLHVERAAHGADSIQTTDALIRCQDWAEQREDARNLWAVNAVRSDLYQPLDGPMAEQVGAWREREKAEHENFGKEIEGLSGRELSDARSQHQGRQDRELHQAFNVSVAGPSHSFGSAM